MRNPRLHSGFETAVEQLASRLTARGHEVIVYCRPHVVDPKLREHNGAQLVHLRTGFLVDQERVAVD